MTKRPERISEFAGQRRILENLELFLSAAKDRGEPLDHVLFYGPPGLGKTTLSQIIATEMGGRLVRTSAPVLDSPATLMSIVSGLEAGDVLFIDEIHRLPTVVEEILYTVMEDRKLDIMVGEGMSARSVSIDLDPFTLVGATTRAGALSRPLFDRFPITFRLDYYALEELVPIVESACSSHDLHLSDVVPAIAARCRGTPRVAIRIVSRIRDFRSVYPDMPAGDLVELAFARMGISELGLDREDMRYLCLLAGSDRPLGLSTLSAALSETAESIEGVIEPYLLRNGLISRTQRGREITDAGLRFVAGSEDKFKAFGQATEPDDAAAEDEVHPADLFGELAAEGASAI